MKVDISYNIRRNNYHKRFCKKLNSNCFSIILNYEKNYVTKETFNEILLSFDRNYRKIKKKKNVNTN